MDVRTMRQEKAKLEHASFKPPASPQTLRRNRMLLIGGIVTVLPAAAFMPSLLTHDQSQTPLLAAVDEMATATHANALVNENAVRSATSGATASDRRESAVPMAFDAGAHGRLAPLAGRGTLPEIVAKPQAAEASETRWFNGRPVRPARTLSMLVTAYSPDERSCGESADGITASGYSVWTNGMKMVAADTDVLPFGALISVPGYDDANIVPVLDRGAAIKGHRLDVLYPTHEQAERWGVQRLNVIVWEYADGLPSNFETQHVLAARE